MPDTKRYVVIENHDGDEWMLGVYDTYEQSHGAVLLDCLKELDDLNNSIRGDEKPSTMTISSRLDAFYGAYMEINATYSKTSHNLEFEVSYRIFFEKGGDEDAR